MKFNTIYLRIQKLFLDDYIQSDESYNHALNTFKLYDNSKIINKFSNSNSEKLSELYRLEKEGFYQDMIYLKMFSGNVTSFIPRITFEEDNFSICYHYPQFYSGSFQLKGTQHEQQILLEKLNTQSFTYGHGTIKSKELMELDDLLSRYGVKYLKWRNQGFMIQFDNEFVEYKNERQIIKIITYIDIIPILNDEYYIVLRHMNKKMKKIGVMEVYAVVGEFKAKNISYNDVYHMFKLSGIILYMYESILE